MSFTLRVKNYRGLRNVEWSPEGVCALVGPNASGKTTLLDAPQLLGDARTRGLSRALEEHGGLDAVRTFTATEQESIVFEVEVSNMLWQVFPANLGRAGVTASERLLRNHDVLMTRDAGQISAKVLGNFMVTRDGLAIEVALDIVPGIEPLGMLLMGYRLYANYEVSELRRSGSQDSTERRLSRRGANVFSVLRNWRDRRDDARLRYEFVLDACARSSRTSSTISSSRRRARSSARSCGSGRMTSCSRRASRPTAGSSRCCTWPRSHPPMKEA